MDAHEKVVTIYVRHSIRCGHCGESHGSVEAVQLCAAEYELKSSRALENRLWGLA